MPYAKAGVGAVATQAYANPGYGPAGLKLLAAGKAPAEVVAALTKGDEGREERQVGVLAADGRAANFTGSKCLEWAGGVSGKRFTVQGNILAGEAVVKAMAAAYEGGKGEELGERLLRALEAGQAAGGDRRGMQSAALLIVREGWGYGGMNDRYVDLRVDESERPIAELRRIFEKAQRR